MESNYSNPLVLITGKRFLSIKYHNSHLHNSHLQFVICINSIWEWNLYGSYQYWLWFKGRNSVKRSSRGTRHSINRWFTGWMKICATNLDGKSKRLCKMQPKVNSIVNIQPPFALWELVNKARYMPATRKQIRQHGCRLCNCSRTTSFWPNF